jgi:hypothetical protein
LTTYVIGDEGEYCSGRWFWLAVPYPPEYDRPGGIISGQLYIHAADAAMWLAIKTPAESGGRGR